MRKEIRLFEPDGWAHSDWSSRSCGYVDHPGSLYPKVNKAECRHCLGVLECQTCGRIVRPSTKAADMKAQIARNCPNLACCSELSWNTCDAKTYHFAIEEYGSQYSVWEHKGHHSHARPPAGRRPPRSVPMPPSKRREHSQTSTTQPKTPMPLHSRNNVVQEPSQMSATQLKNMCRSRTKVVVECEGCSEHDCDAPGPSCPGTLFKIIWNDEKYVFCVFLMQ